MHSVLIIDDEYDIRMLIKLILESAGYAVLEACTGHEGLRQLATQTVDCVLLDIMLPDVNGWEVYRRMRADPALARIPAIILTVRSLLRDQAQYAELQPDGFINKPFDRLDLLQAVESLLAPAENHKPATL